MHIRRLHLWTTAPDSLHSFYAGTLGLPAEMSADGQLIVHAGATRLEFERAQSDPSANYHFAFNIPPHRFTEAQDWLRARVPLVADADGRETFHFESWNAHATYFSDPARNSLELIARHDLPFDAPGPFGPGHLACISEIGMAFADVHEAIVAIERQTGARPYREASDTFAPIGDEYGLFIVVKRGRVWFNSQDRRAEPYPLRAEVEVNGQRYAVEVADGRFEARAM
ncbi:MAG: glyoxalase/bleomycin resistance/dioxygenase family protein [Chloroflexi bacterium]|nr:glyoxalase/bleomycin resistance/dioxygenase family protein [Chloroflexota bacterium]